MNDLLLSVSGLSKKYSRRLRPLLARPSAQLRDDEFWALDDVSFELRRGESLGILGHNGAGKSTLLKLLCGLLKPDRGEIRIHGSVEAMIELGTAFNGLLTGRENVLMAAAVHGLDRRRTASLLDEVVAFAELEEFIDAPFQSYSTGMKARLAYAVAARFEPDILLVDEVLAVGDMSFQYKCLTHMKDYLAAGGALLLISHNITQTVSVCERGLLLHHGRPIFAGTAVEATLHLLESRLALSPPPATTPQAGSVPLEVSRVAIEGPGGGPVRSGDTARVAVRYRADRPVEIDWSFTIMARDQTVIVAADRDLRPRRLDAGEGELSCTIRDLPLAVGSYLLRVGIAEKANGVPLGLWGWERPVTLFDVAEEADADPARAYRIDQLVRLDVDWD